MGKEIRCPYCLDELVGKEKVVRCVACRTPHHQVCFEEHGGCVAFGCGNGINATAGASILKRATIALGARWSEAPLLPSERLVVRYRPARRLAGEDHVPGSPEARLWVEHTHLSPGQDLRARVVVALPRAASVRALEVRIFDEPAQLWGQGPARLLSAQILGRPRLSRRTLFRALSSAALPSPRLGPGIHPFDVEVPRVFGDVVPLGEARLVRISVVVERSGEPPLHSERITLEQAPAPVAPPPPVAQLPPNLAAQPANVLLGNPAHAIVRPPVRPASRRHEPDGVWQDRVEPLRPAPVEPVAAAQAPAAQAPAAQALAPGDPRRGGAWPIVVGIRPPPPLAPAPPPPRPIAAQEEGDLIAPAHESSFVRPSSAEGEAPVPALPAPAPPAGPPAPERVFVSASAPEPERPGAPPPPVAAPVAAVLPARDAAGPSPGGALGVLAELAGASPGTPPEALEVVVRPRDELPAPPPVGLSPRDPFAPSAARATPPPGTGEGWTILAFRAGGAGGPRTGRVLRARWAPRTDLPPLRLSLETSGRVEDERAPVIELAIDSPAPLETLELACRYEVHDRAGRELTSPSFPRVEEAVLVGDAGLPGERAGEERILAAIAVDPFLREEARALVGLDRPQDLVLRVALDALTRDGRRLASGTRVLRVPVSPAPPGPAGEL